MNHESSDLTPPDGTPVAERSDEELMEAYARHADEAALAEIYRRYAPFLMRLIRKRVRREADAEDMLQQTFLQLHRARADFRPGAALRPWLCTIAVNLCSDHGRKKQRRPEVWLAMDSFECSHSAIALRERARDHSRALEALARLPQAMSDLLTAHFIDERPFTELAPELGVNAGTLRVRAFRGCRRLRELLV